MVQIRPGAFYTSSLTEYKYNSVMMDDIDNDYFEMSLEEKKNLKNEISYDLQQLVLNICSQWDDMSSSIDYNEFGSYVQEYLEKAVKQLDCPYLCGHAWNAH